MRRFLHRWQSSSPGSRTGLTQTDGAGGGGPIPLSDLRRLSLRALLLVGLLMVIGVSPMPAAAARGNPDSNSRWQHFDDGSVSHGPDPRPISVAGFEWGRPFNLADHDGVSNTRDVEPDASTGTRARPGLPTVHAIYVYPKGGANRFGNFAAMFQQDLRDASDLLQTDFGRGIRIDERPRDLSAPPGAPVVDITVVESSYTASQLTGFTGSDPVTDRLFEKVREELIGKGFTNADKKYVVWLDVPHGRACGQANLQQDLSRFRDNLNQKSSFAVIYRSYPDPASGGFCRARTVLHELGHAFGALQAKAPNRFDEAHCNDAENDIMCYRAVDRWGFNGGSLLADPAGHPGHVAASARNEVSKYGPPDPGPVTACQQRLNTDPLSPAQI